MTTKQTKKVKMIKVKFTTLDVGQEFQTHKGITWKKTLANRNFKGLESGEAVCLTHEGYDSQIGRIAYFNHVANAYVREIN